jgi:hypothetical protein
MSAGIFEVDGQGRDGNLPPVGMQIVAEPPHEPGVVDFAGRVFLSSILSIDRIWL